MPPQLRSLYLIICCLSLCRCYIHIIKFNCDINIIIRLLFQLGQKNNCLHMQRHLCWNTHFLPRVLQKNTHLYHSTSHDNRSFLSSSLLSTQPFHEDSYIGLWHMVCFCHPYPLAQMSAYTDQLCHPLPYHRQRLSPQCFQILLCQIHQVHQPL